MEEDELLLKVPHLSREENDENPERDYSSGSENDSDVPTPKKITSKLSLPLRGLMGEANLRFARGQLEMAKKMCLEVIRQSPDAFEPYLTLAQMYENNNLKKYKAFLMLAGHLQNHNSGIWSRLADVELQENDLLAAYTCYCRAIKADRRNVDVHIKRINLIKDKFPSRANSVPLLKLQLAKSLPKSKHEDILQICSEVARQYFDNKNYIKAIEALKICLKRIPDHTNQDVLNMMLELLLLCQRYSECLDVLTQFCSFQFDLTLEEDMSIVVNSFTMPEDVDIKTKLIVCLVGLHSYHLVENLIKEMLEKDDNETYATLFDIAEALMGANYYNEALNILIPLVKSKNFSLAAVWLKHAECLTHLEMFDQAIDAYKNVIAMAPNHVDVLYPLAMLLLKQNRKVEALQVLSQDLSTGKLHVAVLMEQMKLLKQIGDLENYWKCCELLLSRHCMVFKNYSELRIVISSKPNVKEKQNKIAKIRMVRGEEENFEWNLENIMEPSPEDEFSLYLEILQFAMDQKAYPQLQKFSFMGLVSKKFARHFQQIFLITCFACIFNKDYYHAYWIARELISQHPETNIVWNIHSIVCNKLQEAIRLGRFFDSISLKFRLPATNTELVKANHFCTVGDYPQCLNYFLKDYKNNRNSYAALIIGVCMLNQYCQRKRNTVPKKSMVEMVTYLFFNYANIRSKYVQQEVYYNLGRMYQQIGIFYMAEHFYQQVFEVDNEIMKEHSEHLDLKMEAAYNLHVIYKNSGNFAAARKILWRYVVI